MKLDNRRDKDTSFVIKVAAMLVMTVFVFTLTGCDLTVTSLSDGESY